MNQFLKRVVLFALTGVLALSGVAYRGVTGASPVGAAAVGVQAELRSSAGTLPALAADVTTATAPAGAVVIGAQPWVADALQGFTQAVSVESGVADSLLAVSTGGVHLPISATTVPATCGQMATDGKGNVYITQAVVDTRNTLSTARGILREIVDPQTGALIGPGTYIATTAGLDGNQPTAAAVGPDGNLYVGFLKNGNIKRVINPAFGSTQVVQSVGNTPNGHAARALAFVGNDLYIGSIDAFSVIHNATSASCTGGCNATTIVDGFAGVPHVGMTSDGADSVYFSVSGENQVWRYTPSTNTFAFIAQGGLDRNGANASDFSFVGAKANLLTLDAGGNLWIGDDTSNGAAVGAGRIWTISSLTLSTVAGGSPTAGANTQAIANVLRGPWFMEIGNTVFTSTFNADGTFTATVNPLTPPTVITTTSGTWTLTPPVAQSIFANPQGNLTLIDSNGVVLLSGDVLLLRADQLVMVTGTSSLSSFGTVFELVITKQTI